MSRSSCIRHLVRRSPGLIVPPRSDDNWRDGIITAASRGSTDTVNKILDFNAYREPEFIAKLVIVALNIAVFNGHYLTAKHLLETQPLLKPEEMTKLVRIASKFGWLKMIKLLYRYGAMGDIKAVLVSVRKGHASVLKFLINDGKGVDISEKRERLLAISINYVQNRRYREKGDEENVKTLLELPLDFNPDTINKALNCGAIIGDPDIVRLAFSRGATDKSTIRVYEGYVYSKRKSCEVVKHYLDYGMYTSYVRRCVIYKHIDVVKLIADYGEDLTDFPEEHEAIEKWTQYRQSNIPTPEVIESLRKLYREMKNYIPINPRRVRGIFITPP
jgi:hypothetical protein